MVAPPAPGLDLRTLNDSFRLALHGENKSERTVEAYTDAVRFFADFLEANGHSLTVTAITRDHIRGFIADQLKQWKPATAHNRYRGLHSFFTWAVEELDELSGHPMNGMKPPQLPGESVPVLTDDQLRRLLKACEGKDFAARRDTAIIRLLMDTGLRRGECVGIMLDDLDLKEQVAVVLGKDGGLASSPSAARQRSPWIATSASAQAPLRAPAEPLDRPARRYDSIGRLPGGRRPRRRCRPSRLAAPPASPLVARIEEHLAEQTADLARLGVEEASVHALRAYGTWEVLARLRRRTELGGTTNAQAALARGKIAETARFLAWLHAHGRRLADCAQADLDVWTSARSNHVDQFHEFVVWALKRRLVTGVQPPTRQRRDALRPLPHTERWGLARQLLDDDDLDVADRAAGLLVLLYGQSLSRITRLTVAHIHHEHHKRPEEHASDGGGDTFLTLGRDRVLLPEPLAGLIRRLPTRQHPGVAGRLAPGTTWLFPSSQPGQPLHPVQLGRRLRRLGLRHSSSGRTAALLHLAAELPARVLADLLNLHVSTADRWVKAAGGDWSHYVAERSHEST